MLRGRGFGLFRNFSTGPGRKLFDLDRTLSKKALEELQGFSLVTSTDLLWGSQDSFGHVNNCTHIQLFEQSRCVYFLELERRSGTLWTNNPHDPRRAASRVGPILANISCKYTAILEWPNVVAIGARVSGFMRDRTRFKMQHKIVVVSSGQVVAVGEGDCACVDYATSKVVPVPAAIQEAINEIEGRAVPDV
jgi:acyl-CoA thioesterase FadM